VSSPAAAAQAVSARAGSTSPASVAPFAPSPRERTWERLGRETFDLLIIGGGVIGAATARDAALRGLRVAVIEAEDVAAGTSSRSSKLIHGGLRYLEQGDFSLVFESVSERRVMQNLAPHLVRPLGFLFPIYDHSPVGINKLRVGLMVYEGLALFRSPKWHRTLSKKKVIACTPAIQKRGLHGAPLYWDCMTDDARLTLETMLDATKHGAALLTYGKVVGLLRNEGGRICGVRARDTLDASVEPRTIDIHAAAVVNANINLRGLWAFNYKGARHNTSTKHIFYQTKADGSVDTANPKTIPARFGPRWAGAPYGLRLNSGQTGTNGIKEGYDLISHMANLPFTMEFISVKLCRLLVHDGFHLGYDFSDDQHTPEEDLIYQCMLAWDNGSPKGQIRDLLRVILNSDLFRSNAGSLQKIKTPLEFAVSTVRALRSQNDDGSFTADSDGYALAGIINRAGRLRLFDRAEPDGYPEDAPAWISAGTLTERIRFVQSALMPVTMTGKSDAGAATRTDPVALLRKKLPAGQLNDANAVAAYFTGLLFPAEGTANLAEFRELAVRFLDTADDGTTASPFNALAVGTTNYDLRVRGMVALLMSTQRFHEQ
jgi:hypothetical protein